MNFSTNPTTEAGMTEHAAHTSTTPTEASTPEVTLEGPMDVAEKITVEAVDQRGRRYGSWTWVLQESGEWCAFLWRENCKDWIRDHHLDAESDERLWNNITVVRGYGKH
ncbi:hypothetical protein [Streptosporangium longisporum]|uniref:Uncharacterized protein n=1 Tax=Streptosporangium longisporum TaxID=46187 RepID=A0ABP6L219_9ACTN